jgi:hypothetical protein
MRYLLLAASAVLSLSLQADAGQAAPQDDIWAAYRFLLGDWVGEGEGGPGQGKGEFSFAAELQGKVLVRRNRAEYPASGDRPALSHEDLLIVYHEKGGKTQKAIYFDSEGHVVDYTPSTSLDGKALIFLSDAKESSPRYRLSYIKQETGKVTVKFEIAPPGKAEAFKTYLEGTVRKK